MAQRDQLAHHCAPLLFVQLGADAEHRQLVVPELHDALGRTADQHINHMPRAEALPGAIDAGQPFCAATVPSRTRGGDRQLSQLPHSGRDRFAEIIEQTHAPAPGGLAQADQRIELADRDALERIARRSDWSIMRRCCTMSARP